MPITIADSERRTQYVISSSTDPMDVGFPIFDLADVAVYLDDVLQSSDYTVAGTLVDGSYADATVTPDSPWSGTVDIVCKSPPERVTQFQEGSDLPISDLNLALNILNARMREIYDRVQYALRLPFGSSEIALESAPGEVVGWNAGGTRLEGKGDVDDLLVARDEAVAAADDIETRYLGAFASNPAGTVTGQLYFNTTANEIRVWNGSSWQVSYNPGGGSVNSFNGRTGSVLPIAGDYSASEITNDSTVGGVNVDDALDTLGTDKADAATTISGGGLASGGGDLSANRTITVTAASQAEAEAGALNTVTMTPLRTAQAIAALATGDWTLVDETVIAAPVASYDVGSLSAYREIKIEIANLKPASANANLLLRTDTGAADVGDFGVSDYSWTTMLGYISNTNGNGNAAANGIQISGHDTTRQPGTSGIGICGEIIYREFNQAVEGLCTWQVGFEEETGGNELMIVMGSGARLDATARDFVQLIFSTGNIASGVVRVWGK